MSHSTAPTPPPTPDNPISSVTRNPITVAIFSALLAIAGKTFTDRLTMESRETNTSAEVTALDRRLTEHLADAVSRKDYEHVLEGQRESAAKTLTRDEFAQFATQINTRIEDMRSDVRDIKRALTH